MSMFSEFLFEQLGIVLDDMSFGDSGSEVD